MTDTGANNLPNEQEEVKNENTAPKAEETKPKADETTPEAEEQTQEEIAEKAETPEQTSAETPNDQAVESADLAETPQEEKQAATTQEAVEPKTESSDPAAGSSENAEDIDKDMQATAELHEEHGKEETEQIDYSALSKEELVEAFKKLFAEKELQEIKNDVEYIRSAFYKQHNAELSAQREKFIEDGGLAEDFEPAPLPLEEEFKTVYNNYKQKKADLHERVENEKRENAEEKRRVIQGIEDLINSQEAINTTFNEFRALQERWKGIGQVPQDDVKVLWERYHYTVEKFYDYIKINKELRDLDLRKNLDLKIKLCERAEELLLEPSIVNSFKELQELHNQWREIGPVPRDKREDLWDRFKLATTKINKAHQEYYEKLKEEQEKNLKTKTLLCEKVEEINQLDLKTFKEWEERATEVIEIQKIWKLIGFTPRKFNTEIYTRFRTSCDEFFAKKRDFYNAAKDEQKKNLAAKMELVEQAEVLKDSTDWKKTTEIYVSIQKKWKDIGPVPRKHSDAIWERFRGACNAFFDHKKKHFSSIDNEQADNLKKKEEIIEKLKGFEFSGDKEDDLNQLKDYQNEWTEIGFVPFGDKDRIQKEFRAVINALFSQLRIDEGMRQEIKFKNRMEELKQSPKAQSKLRFERDKVLRKLQKIEKDIVTWENNIGFFANSKNADALVRDVQQKIEQAREYAAQLREKLDIIDNSEE